MSCRVAVRALQPLEALLAKPDSDEGALPSSVAYTDDFMSFSVTLWQVFTAVSSKLKIQG